VAGVGYTRTAGGDMNRNASSQAAQLGNSSGFYAPSIVMMSESEVGGLSCVCTTDTAVSIRYTSATPNRSRFIKGLHLTWGSAPYPARSLAGTPTPRAAPSQARRARLARYAARSVPDKILVVSRITG